MVPSWNFFDVIAPSPRVEYALTAAPDAATEDDWQEFQPRPQSLSPAAMAQRLFWNPRWNESLFLVSCAERLLEEPTDHSQDEIFRRIAADLAHAPEPWLAFRVVILSQSATTIGREVYYQARSRRLASLIR